MNKHDEFPRQPHAQFPRRPPAPAPTGVTAPPVQPHRRAILDLVMPTAQPRRSAAERDVTRAW
jgi:hypothetical protein